MQTPISSQASRSAVWVGGRIVRIDAAAGEADLALVVGHAIAAPGKHQVQLAAGCHRVEQHQHAALARPVIGRRRRERPRDRRHAHHGRKARQRSMEGSFDTIWGQHGRSTRFTGSKSLSPPIIQPAPSNAQRPSHRHASPPSWRASVRRQGSSLTRVTSQSKAPEVEQDLQMRSDHDAATSAAIGVLCILSPLGLHARSCTQASPSGVACAH